MSAIAFPDTYLRISLQTSPIREDEELLRPIVRLGGPADLFLAQTELTGHALAVFPIFSLFFH